MSPKPPQQIVVITQEALKNESFQEHTVYDLFFNSDRFKSIFFTKTERAVEKIFLLLEKTESGFLPVVILNFPQFEQNIIAIEKIRSPKNPVFQKIPVLAINWQFDCERRIKLLDATIDLLVDVPVVRALLIAQIDSFHRSC